MQREGSGKNDKCSLMRNSGGRQYFSFLHGFLQEFSGMDQIPEDSCRNGPESTGMDWIPQEWTRNPQEWPGICRNENGMHVNSPLILATSTLRLPEYLCNIVTS